MGPINPMVYGSFAPRKHAFVIARREATWPRISVDLHPLVNAPMHPVLDWIGQTLQQGAVPVDLRQRVGDLLRRSR